jgi:DNA-binding NarL/FixJ family response regulator
MGLTATTSILLADDHDGIRRGLRELLELQLGWQVVGEAGSGREALEKAVQLTPDVVILDISMPELDGISAAPLIHEALPEAELLVVSQHDTPDMVTKALAAGIRAYVLKSQASRDVVLAVQAVRKHTSFLSRELAGCRLAAEPAAGSGTEGALESLPDAGGGRPDRSES